MRWALNPTITAASTCGCQGRQELWRPDPAVGMAGFGSGSPSEPRVEMAGFDRASRRYLPTVSRLISSSRAIRRCDQPCAAKVKIECCKLTLSWFIASMCRLHGTQRNVSLKVAGFHSTLPGWFSPSADNAVVAAIPKELGPSAERGGEAARNQSAVRLGPADSKV